MQSIACSEWVSSVSCSTQHKTAQFEDDSFQAFIYTDTDNRTYDNQKKYTEKKPKPSQNVNLQRAYLVKKKTRKKLTEKNLNQCAKRNYTQKPLSQNRRQTYQSLKKIPENREKNVTECGASSWTVLTTTHKRNTHAVRHGTVLIIFTVILQTTITAQNVVYWKGGQINCLERLDLDIMHYV